MSEPEPRHRRGILIPDDLWRRLRALAALRGVSVSDLVEGILRREADRDAR